MRKMIGCALVVAMAAGITLARADVTVTPVVTLKDVQAAYAAGKYQDCLKKISSATGLKTMSATDRATLMSLKAECLLAEKQGPAASEAFLGAAAAYTAAKDPKGAATCKATSNLIHNSPEFDYTPKTAADKTPLPIIDTAKRPAALTAYFNDQLAAVQDAAKSLAKAKLADILLFSPRLQDLDTLEVAATGTDAKTNAIQKALATQGKTVIDTFLAASNKKADTIAANAAKMVPVPGGALAGGMSGNGGGGRGGRNQGAKQAKGLTDQDKTTLTDMETDADKIQPDTKALVPALALDADFFSTQVTNATALHTKIEAILGGNFKVAAGGNGP